LKGNRQRDLNLEKLESISLLSSALAHEIRNPMTSVKGFLQLITSNDLNDEKKREYALIAMSEIDRAENIIRDFLAYSKPKNKCIEYIRLDEVIQKVLTILTPLANLNNVEMFFDGSTDKLIHGDKSLVQQCLINLCKNAIEAMNNGGILSIRTWEDLNHLNVEIKDTGVGMSEEQLLSLGNPFFSTKGEEGTGLGIMLAYSIFKKMNGSIQVTSKLGNGTTFLLEFPLERSQEK
jgi:two-component system sporulation sensor kinase B